VCLCTKVPEWNSLCWLKRREGVGRKKEGGKLPFGRDEIDSKILGASPLYLEYLDCRSSRPGLL
jgi:hypothetical protein